RGVPFFLGSSSSLLICEHCEQALEGRVHAPASPQKPLWGRRPPSLGSLSPDIQLRSAIVAPFRAQHELCSNTSAWIRRPASKRSYRTNSRSGSTSSAPISPMRGGTVHTPIGCSRWHSLSAWNEPWSCMLLQI